MTLVKLTSISPIAYETIKIGDKLSIAIKIPKKNEFRDKIGANAKAVLIFKGTMKIGAIPKKNLEENEDLLSKKYCVVTEVDITKNLISVKI